MEYKSFTHSIGFSKPNSKEAMEATAPKGANVLYSDVDLLRITRVQQAIKRMDEFLNSYDGSPDLLIETEYKIKLPIANLQIDGMKVIPGSSYICFNGDVTDPQNMPYGYLKCKVKEYPDLSILITDM